MSEAVTVLSLTMMTSTVSEESPARDTRTHARTPTHTHTHTHTHTRSRFYVKVCFANKKISPHAVYIMPYPPIVITIIE